MQNGFPSNAFVLLFSNLRILYILPLHEKCPNTESFPVRIFLYSEWIQENTDQKKFRIWTLSTQCTSAWLSWLTFQLRGTTNEFCNEFTNEALLLADSYYKFLRCYKTLKKFFSKNSFLGLIYFLRLVL